MDQHLRQWQSKPTHPGLLPAALAEQHTHCLSSLPPISFHAPAQVLPEQICLLIPIGRNLELCLFDAVLWQPKALCMTQQYLEKEGICPASEKIHLQAIILSTDSMNYDNNKNQQEQHPQFHTQPQGTWCAIAQGRAAPCSLGKWKNQTFPPVRQQPLALLPPHCMPREHTQTDPRKEREGSNYFCFNYSQFKTMVWKKRKEKEKIPTQNPQRGCWGWLVLQPSVLLAGAILLLHILQHLLLPEVLHNCTVKENQQN